MFKSAIAIAAVVLCAGAANGTTLRSESYALPSADGDLPGGKAAELAQANCLTCHSAGMILNQPALSAATWGEEVNKMRTVYKAPVAAEDVPAIVAYLATLKPGS